MTDGCGCATCSFPPLLPANASSWPIAGRNFGAWLSKELPYLELNPLASPLVQLPGGLFEVEVLAGPVAGAYVSRQLTIEQLAAYLGTGETQQQISSQPGKRTQSVALLQPLTLLSVVALVANNVSSYALQVNRYAGGTWAAGPPRASLAAAQADVNALTATDWAAGAELEITTVAVDAAAEAILIVSFRA